MIIISIITMMEEINMAMMMTAMKALFIDPSYEFMAALTVIFIFTMHLLWN